ncbi:hypothetical protein F0U61_15455 [Archangium violaceum]|uniref:hypothetical protein n=1 Tax=Archangium violaceum TaxID=83451 RepID=UPI002B2F7E01|nr:hypothetical protein F0U61_15455 [Archangium violaceum]
MAGANPSPGSSRTTSDRWSVLLLLLLSAAIVFSLGLLWLEMEVNGRHLVLALMGSLMPSLLLLGYRLLSAQRIFGVRREEVRSYQSFLSAYAEKRTNGTLPPIFNRELSGEVLQQQGYLRQFILGVLLLAVPFFCLALLLVTQGIDGMNPDGLRGLELAGCGIYVYTLGLAIFRIRTAALSAEFVMSSALRALILMVLGYVLGSIGFFRPTESVSAAFLYFSLGLFPSVGMKALNQRLRQALTPDAPGTEPLPLSYVDGITEQVAERLEELGVFDIQHLARVEPGWLALRTLYPLSRIIDWMDQALLITYLREEILHSREVGIRGAIDMRAIYRQLQRAGASGFSPEEARLQEARSERSLKVLQELANKSKLSIETLQHIGATLQGSSLVDLLACLQNGCCPSRKKKVSPQPIELDARPEPRSAWIRRRRLGRAVSVNAGGARS